LTAGLTQRYVAYSRAILAMMCWFFLEPIANLHVRWFRI
jgi:hypothetical protein